MSIIKSFSVGNGDMFYINHSTDSFSIIDCCLNDNNKDAIVNEIISLSKNKGILRFISTHPDQDHLAGIEYLDNRISLNNFYCVENNATKENPSESFKHYCKLRDGSHHYYICKDIARKWINISDEMRGGAGISFLWPDTSNNDFITELELAAHGINPNNISPIFTYSLKNGVTAMWMGDIEHDYLEKIKNEIAWSKVDILFAPHHGRSSGKISSDILIKLDPRVIIIGEAPSKDLDYYSGYNTIKQNSAGDIVFKCEQNVVHIYISSDTYKQNISFLKDEKVIDSKLGNYIFFIHE